MHEINSSIKKEFKQLGLAYWQIADILGVCEMTVSRMLRHELTDEQKKELLAKVKEGVKTE